MESSGQIMSLSHWVEFVAHVWKVVGEGRGGGLLHGLSHSAHANIMRVHLQNEWTCVGVFYDKQMPAAFQILFGCNQIYWSWHAEVNTELLSLRKVVFTICGARSAHSCYKYANPSLLE